eukprot:TRINITY_DN50735_c0_g1_i1.p1 TRINITY_DN50735_c0_g1~~TRINITY_DN50735_c0_g1_i1.p1  ORF type:complete len:198 (+),score=85.09 TRINITY_DN50735_c0_g1_i1:86-679(+)
MRFLTVERLLNTPRPIALMYWYAAVQIIALVNYVQWMQFNEDIVGNDIRTLYLAFLVISIITYVGISATCFRAAATFYTDNTPDGRRMRSSRQRAGIIFLFVLSDCPMFFIDLSLHHRAGNQGWLQGLDFTIRTVTCIIGSLISWFAYLGVFVDLVHKCLGAERRIKLHQYTETKPRLFPLLWREEHLGGAPDGKPV